MDKDDMDKDDMDPPLPARLGPRGPMATAIV